ncbi:hypothetical protein [Stenotrophomonas nematodicola]|uniref:Carboxypeptidase regulatory-like domain-containing protein n=1 Tax=Stenotrophomonas nematodicola TaxID=2656746 RepID=A0ABW7CXB6_9GAMM
MHERLQARLAGVGRGVLTALAMTMTAANAGSPQAEAAPITRAAVQGTTLAGWTEQWWRWAAARPIAPYMDPDGRLCDMDQDGPVWFLAGTNGRFQPRRECVVPEGKHLLLPIINMVIFASPGRRECTALQARAAVNNEHLLSAVVLLDGQPLGDMRAHRVSSNGCFRLDPEDDTSALAAADGYWLMLTPLPRGRHTLSVGANYGAPDGKAYSTMKQTFEYVLHVGGRSQMVQVERVQPVRAAP